MSPPGQRSDGIKIEQINTDTTPPMALTPSHPQRGCGFLTLVDLQDEQPRARAGDVVPYAAGTPRTPDARAVRARGAFAYALHSPFASSSFASPFSSPPRSSRKTKTTKTLSSSGIRSPHTVPSSPSARLEFDDGELLSAPSSSRPESPFPDFSLSQGGGGHEQFHSFATYSYSPHGIETVRSPEFGVESYQRRSRSLGLRLG
ncbi:hypothetical protein B0H14DRAFT_3464544 [Mycena olivaceomarginata]|nr:hypothetical protein B0H14DRAFT_3464544 [Mycena olivaceomarginata]